jgi:asparagine synthase (glutamine-hydrolysing)
VPAPVIDTVTALLPAATRPRNAGARIHRLAGLLAAHDGDALLADLSAVWPDEARLVPAATGACRLQAATGLADALPNAVSRMQYYDTRAFLPDDVMTKVDRCTMAVALEAREPLLDHRLVEFAWRLAPAMKYDGRTGKRLLRRVLHRYVPADLVERPKSGFTVPLADWLRGDLRGWAEALLAPQRLAADGIFAAAEVRRLWDQHQTRRANRELVLWNVLMFQAWKEHYRV